MRINGPPEGKGAACDRSPEGRTGGGDADRQRTLLAPDSQPPRWRVDLHHGDLRVVPWGWYEREDDAMAEAAKLRWAGHVVTVEIERGAS